MTRSTRKYALTLAAALALTVTACAGQDDGAETDTGDEETADSGETSDDEGAGEPVTIEWWHNSNNPPGRDVYEQAAADFMEEHPNVTIEISAQAHADMLTRLDAALQSGDMPDVYMERGGGELVSKVEAGLVRDITDDAAESIEKLSASISAYQVDGRTYALPFNGGMVGFFYNTALFDEAGISEPPETLDEWFAAVEALKDAGIEPVALGAGDGWPAGHYWYYTALRHCDYDVLTEALLETRDFSDPCFLEAGETLQEISDAQPFNAGYLTTPAQEGPTSASGLLATGKVAMELAGQWEPGVMQGLTEDGEGLGENTGWFPFPQLPGQEGDPTGMIGGGDAWGLSADAPDEAVDFIEYLVSDEMQRTFAENDMGIPTNPAAAGYNSDPVLLKLSEELADASYVQLYFDTLLGEGVGPALNEAVVNMLAGEASPQDIVDALQEAVDAEQ